MKTRFRKILSYTGRTLLGLFSLIVLYFLLVLLLGLIPANPGFESAEKGVPLYVLSNGIHTDFVVPTTHKAIDWRSVVSPEAFAAEANQAPFIGFGWGDKGFYLDTPTWAELKASTALRAVFLPSPTAMHVTYYSREPTTGENCRRVTINEAQYQQLIQYIRSSFETNSDDVRLIPDSGYTPRDNFYEALGSYHLFYTCNSWVNQGLKRIGVRTAVWSPFDKGILYQLKKE